jgi:inorganic pyrophosphatase/exopolyphosphatase
LINTRQNEILTILNQLQTQNNLNLIFLSILDIEAKQNHFITTDATVQALLTATLNINFENNHALRQGIIMRKEIIPLLKATMEKP